MNNVVTYQLNYCERTGGSRVYKRKGLRKAYLGRYVPVAFIRTDIVLLKAYLSKYVPLVFTRTDIALLKESKKLPTELVPTFQN